MQSEWFQFTGVEKVPSPVLLVYPERITQNILKMIKIAGDANKLMPHVKTHKMEAVIKLQLEKGISKFKCATIAEAEMVAQAGAQQLLLAYPLVGFNAERFLQLNLKYPNITSLTLVDSVDGATKIAELFSTHNKIAHVLIDVNVGMNRTGISLSQLPTFYNEIKGLKGVAIEGLHAYDGHIHDKDKNERFKKAQEVITPVATFRAQLELDLNRKLLLVAGGTGTFPYYAAQDEILCSPGTSLLWDEGYRSNFPDLDFEIAALLLTRVVSNPEKNTYCLDLGYKAVASENPLPRVVFPKLPNAQVLFQSEEHLVIKNAEELSIGQIVFAIPIHICPTVALYDEVYVVEDNKIATKWPITARTRKISI